MSILAFKEWAPVVEALGRGRQTILLRKGGIEEDGGAFDVSGERFAIYPTSYHPTPEQLVPDWRDVSCEAEPIIRYVAGTVFVRKITDLETLRRLEPFHVWTPQVVEERFRRWRDPGCHVLLVRVRRLRRPVPITPRPEYGGCKSWISLVEHVAFDESDPVLDAATFADLRARIEAILRAPATATG